MTLPVRILALLSVSALLASAEVAPLKYTIGVYDFDNRSGWTGQINLPQSFGAVLTDALHQTGRFIVLGETELRGAAMAEQDLAASGRTAGGSRAPATGQLTPAQLLVRGEITHLQTVSGGDGGIAIRGIAVGGSRARAEINAVMYIVDTTTGQVKASKRMEGSSERGGMRIGVARGNVRASVGGFKDNNLATAVEAAIEQAVDFLLEQLDTMPWTADVVAARGGQIYLNRGERENVRVGQRFVAGEVDELRDPGTGELLDVIIEQIATLEVTQVRERIAICRVVDGQEDLPVGTRVMLP
ncbi:MAG: hypothetical protein EA425_08315 [Puniceicoccaceae bacterium]|nr:MAG: hypothetical protein EA425_08315 [Puniceicoccaceae bacterium]